MFFLNEKLFSDFHFWTFLKMSNFHFSEKVFQKNHALFTSQHNALICIFHIKY